jgi:hypothetical protein
MTLAHAKIVSAIALLPMMLLAAAVASAENLGGGSLLVTDY